MTTLGFLNPKAGAGQSRLIFNLGWVLADAGFRVGLVDFDPQAGLTELAGASGDTRRSVYDALAPLVEAEGTPTMPEPLAPELVELAPRLWLARGHIRASILDDAMALAWDPSVAEPRAQLLVSGIVALLEEVVDLHQLDVILCDIGASLGPLSRAVALAVDALVVPLAPRAIEDAALWSLASCIRRWREPPWHGRDDPYRALGFVIMRPSGVDEVDLDQLAAEYRSHLVGVHLGTIKEFPSLASIARSAHKPEIELTIADGAAGSLSSAVLDLRRQYEALATRVAKASGLFGDVLLESVSRALFDELDNEIPSELDALSSHTNVRSVADVELASAEVRHGGLRVVGSASVDVMLAWGGSRDGAETPMSFPLRFDLELDRSHESATAVHSITVDTSSYGT